MEIKKVEFIAVILAVAFLFFVLYNSGTDIENDTNGYEDNGEDIIPSGNESTEPEEIEYDDSFSVSQRSLGLDHEYIQYEILFHEDDTIKVDISMTYEANSFENLFYLVYLSDGRKELTYKTFLQHEPTAKIDITNARKRFSFLHTPSSNERSFSKTFSVNENDTWYLTIVVYKSGTETIEVSLKSRESSLEMISSETGDTMEYFTTQDADFSGRFLRRYRGVSIFGLGYASGKVTKTITTTEGSLFYCNVNNFIDADIIVTHPNGKTYQHASKKVGKFMQNNTHYFEGTSTAGDWIFNIDVKSFPKKASASLFYIDINPHGDMNFTP